MPEPRIARPIFSNEDFDLLRRAVQIYLQQNPNAADTTKYSNLYHRLGRHSSQKPTS